MRSEYTLSHPVSGGAGYNREAISPQPRDFAAVSSPVDGERVEAAGGTRWQARRRGAGQRAPGAPAIWYTTLRRWSPGIIPPLIGTLLLLAAGALATHRIGQQPVLVDPHTLLILFVLYLVTGTVYGLLLYMASDTTVWWLVLMGGLAVYIIGTSAVIGGPLTGVLAGIVLAAAAARYNHQHVQVVPEGHVLVTLFAGGFHRTLPAGRALLLPGERAAATLDTTERRFTCPTQRARVPVGSGETYTARAAATVAYNLLPSEVYRAAQAPEQWEQHLHDLVCASLQLALEDWGARMIESEGAVPEGLLARTMLAHLREQARAQGVRVSWLNVRDIWLAPGGETLPVEGWDDDEDDEDDEIEDEAADGAPGGQGRARSAAAPALPPARRSLPPAQPSEPELPVPATPPSTTEAEALDEREILSADVLSDAYEAVREGHIHDPVTIRELAQAFLRIAANAELNADFPYDAMQAAQILIDRAKRLEREARANARTFDGN